MVLEMKRNRETAGKRLEKKVFLEKCGWMFNASKKLPLSMEKWNLDITEINEMIGE